MQPKGIVANLAVILLLAACTLYADEWEKKYAVSAKPEIRVTTNDADLRISSWERSEVYARVVTEGWRIQETEVRIREQQVGNSVELDVHIPTDSSAWPRIRRSVQIELTLPREVTLEARTEDGNVTLEPLAGSLRVNTGDGDIRARGLRGSLRLSSGDGNIDCSEADGELIAATEDGDVNLDGRFDVLEIRSGDGNVQAIARPGSRLARNWSVRTGDGDVVLRLPPDLAADVSAETGDGSIQSGLPLTVSGVVSEHQLRGKLNGGGNALDIRTADGSIRLDRF